MAIYAYDMRQTDFLNNGLGEIRPKECKVEEEANGLYELTMICPITTPEQGEKWRRLERGTILSCDVPSPSGSSEFLKKQLFRVYRISWELDQVTAYARHISYDLGRNIIGNGKFDLNASEALEAIKSNLYNASPLFSIDTDIESDVKSVDWTRINPMQALFDPETGFCSVYEAEAVRDNYAIHFLQKAGRDTNALIEYGKNLTDLYGKRMKKSWSHA